MKTTAKRGMAFAVCAIACAVQAATPQPRMSVAGKAVAVRAAKAAGAPSLRLAEFPAEMAARVWLPPPSSPVLAKAARQAGSDKRVRIGMARDVEGEAPASPSPLRWLATADGGRVARIVVTSADARSLRVGLASHGLPRGSELRFVGAHGSAAVIGPVAGEGAAAMTRERGLFWSPLTEGDTQVIEAWIPAAADPAAVDIAVRMVSHIDAAPSEMFKSSAAGASGACNRDVACVAGADEAMRRAARAVARMVFTQDGASYLCTGTLMSDGDASSAVPYFHTAAHCVGTQAAAATLNTFWFLEAGSCDGAPAPYRQLGGGATLLFANPSTDVALLRLNDEAPEGAWFSGWDASPVGAGERVVALHHPRGDLKKASLGEALAAGAAGSTVAAWTVGTTEGGSSGSGLFTRAADGEYVLRGGLRGGSASCSSSGDVSNPANRDSYSRLDLEATNLAAWLKSADRPGEDRTGMWWNPAEPGWGLSLVQGAGGIAFVTVYTYDAGGDSMWLAMPDARWKSAGSLEGALYSARGVPLDGSYDAARASTAPVGTARIEFASDGSGTLTLEMNGKRIVKPLRRFAI